jgi:hypothetical protein
MQSKHRQLTTRDGDAHLQQSAPHAFFLPEIANLEIGVRRDGNQRPFRQQRHVAVRIVAGQQDRVRIKQSFRAQITA